MRVRFECPHCGFKREDDIDPRDDTDELICSHMCDTGAVVVVEGEMEYETDR